VAHGTQPRSFETRLPWFLPVSLVSGLTSAEPWTDEGGDAGSDFAGNPAQPIPSVPRAGA